MQETLQVRNWQVTFLNDKHIHVTDNKKKKYDLTYKVTDKRVSLLPTNEQFYYDCPKYLMKYIEEKILQ